MARHGRVLTASVYQLHRITWSVRVLIAYTFGPMFNWSPTKVRKGLEEHGVKILPSIRAICIFCRKFRLSRSIADNPRKGRPALLRPHHRKYIDWCIRLNREVTMAYLQSKMKSLFNLKVSSQTLKNAISKLGWRKTQTRYCQMIRDANKPKRLIYSMLCMARKDHFLNCIFTDEASIEMTRGGTLRFRHRDEASVFAKIAKPKHPFKVHVWAGISHKGATNICTFTGKLNAPGLELILKETLLPFLSNFQQGHRFVQDNDPKHTSKHIKEFMTENGIFHWRTPPESPDLNPIEMVWADLKMFLKTVARPTTKDQLLAGIRVYWATLTPHKCRRFIEHLKKVMPMVVEVNGGASGY